MTSSRSGDISAVEIEPKLSGNETTTFELFFALSYNKTPSTPSKIPPNTLTRVPLINAASDGERYCTSASYSPATLTKSAIC